MSTSPCRGRQGSGEKGGGFRRPASRAAGEYSCRPGMPGDGSVPAIRPRAEEGGAGDGAGRGGEPGRGPVARREDPRSDFLRNGAAGWRRIVERVELHGDAEVDAHPLTPMRHAISRGATGRAAASTLSGVVRTPRGRSLPGGLRSRWREPGWMRLPSRLGWSPPVRARPAGRNARPAFPRSGHRFPWVGHKPDADTLKTPHTYSGDVGSISRTPGPRVDHLHRFQGCGNRCREVAKRMN